MAEKAAEECRDIPFDVCFCSPLIRARETADIVLRGRNVPIITDKRLEEMCFGIYEGLENSFDIPDCPVNEFFFHPESYVAVNGAESIDALFARTGEFLEEMVEPRLGKGENVLIMGHGAMNSSIVCRLRKRPRAEFWREGIENCKLMRLL